MGYLHILEGNICRLRNYNFIYLNIVIWKNKMYFWLSFMILMLLLLNCVYFAPKNVKRAGHVGIFHTKLHSINPQLLFQVFHYSLPVGRASKTDLGQGSLLSNRQLRLKWKSWESAMAGSQEIMLMSLNKCFWKIASLWITSEVSWYLWKEETMWSLGVPPFSDILAHVFWKHWHAMNIHL